MRTELEVLKSFPKSFSVSSTHLFHDETAYCLHSFFPLYSIFNNIKSIGIATKVNALLCGINLNKSSLDIVDNKKLFL